MTNEGTHRVNQRWICCQIGAREHYSVPRALKGRQVLEELITDIWARPNGWFGWTNNGISRRFHEGLSDTVVRSANLSSLMFEMRSRTKGKTGWEVMIARNDRFQKFAIAHLDRRKDSAHPLTVFAYSYAARLIFKFARRRGWKTVLGQIDAGPEDEHAVAEHHGLETARLDLSQPAPKEHWANWRSELQLADHVVVNSMWSKTALLKAGVPAEKLYVIPLAYEKPQDAIGFKRNYPTQFTHERPLRVLFLGQISFRKGISALFDAIRITKDLPIEFWLVGPRQVSVPEDLRQEPRIKWFQAVPNHRVSPFYRAADVFLFPTLSDGFGLTQLEAQAWKLPVIASRYCGSVVEHGVNGSLLKEVSGMEIALELTGLINSPDQLQALSNQCGVNQQFTLTSLATSLTSL